MSISRNWLLFLLPLFLLGGGGVLGLMNSKSSPEAAQLAQAGIILLPAARELTEVYIDTIDGQRFSPAFFEGRWTLVLFGYTYCPDICPATLSELQRIRAAMPEEVRNRLGVTMISVDPQRDTHERLQQYMNYFDPAFMGMTGEISEVQKASSLMGQAFVPGNTSKEHYTVDHSGNLALIDPQGRQVGYVRGPLRESELIQQLPKLLRLDVLP
ncbi:SCO family protein [Pseudomonas sp. MYb185]|uniref:SCO family protein n=1 Tax=Pseudomonas sp. MYb185 TaxID=1848729 RepID=UPI000CFE1EA4|nr:SCO family protein [Pseudomonas sp. MYb185]PRB81553.1 cytochrome c oxidase assembly protein [Pseudomonas sp. MYb185]